MFAEGLNLGRQFRVVPVGVFDRRLEIVDDQHFRHAAEMPEGVFNRANEVLRGLTIDRLAVSLAAVAQHDPKDVRSSPLPIRQLDPRSRAEINLGLFAGLALHPTKRQRPCPSQLGHKPPHAVILVAEPFGPQVLIDSLARKPLLQLLQDHLPIRLAGAATALPSPRKLWPSKPRSRPPSWGAIRPGRECRKPAPSRGALWLVLTRSREALLAGFELAGGTPGRGTLGRRRSPSLRDASAAKGLSRPSVAWLPATSEPMGALAGFGTQLLARMYFATVSRSTCNSRAIRRCGQPCSCNFKIA